MTLGHDGVAWRGPREKRQEFFEILFSTLTDENDVIMDWHCGVGMSSLLFFLNFSFRLIV